MSDAQLSLGKTRVFYVKRDKISEFTLYIAFIIRCINQAVNVSALCGKADRRRNLKFAQTISRVFAVSPSVSRHRVPLTCHEEVALLACGAAHAAKMVSSALQQMEKSQLHILGRVIACPRAEGDV